MKLRRFVCLLALLVPLAVPAIAQSVVGQIADQRFNEIRAKRARSEKITEEERDYAESIIERRNQEESAKRSADYAKAHPPRESTGLVPLPDLGKQTYKGGQGGLYPGGENTPPRAHLQAGLKLASQIVPLDREGRPSANGRIALCTIGMSNTTQESRSFLKLAAADRGLNPKFTFVDCAQGAQTAAKIADPTWPYWKLVSERLANAEVTAQQVQLVWMKEANGSPTASPPSTARRSRWKALCSRCAARRSRSK
jgi:hypothetical protein